MQSFVFGFSQDFASLFMRVFLGVFFVLARFSYVFDPSKPEGDKWFSKARHASLRNKLDHCGWGCTDWLPPFIAWVEILAGLALIVGLLSTLSAAGLLVICVIGTMCTGYEKTMCQNPVDRIDVCSCYLWCPEPIYVVLALAIVLVGPGTYSLDYLIWSWFV